MDEDQVDQSTEDNQESEDTGSRAVSYTHLRAHET